jgi:uncharacterized protein DUF1566
MMQARDARALLWMLAAGLTANALVGCTSKGHAAPGDASGSSSGAPAGGSAGGGCEGGSCATDPNWAQWPMPNSPLDVAAGAPNPQSFTDRSDGTVIDNVTGLIWQQAIPAMLYAWADALSYCSRLTLAGRSDWRLPTYVELVSIVDYSRSSPAIDAVHFPNTTATNFWSSSPVGTLPSKARFVSFSDGSSDSYTSFDVSLLYNVRCCIAPPAAANTAQGRYTIAGGTVYDTKTKLTWQQMSPSIAGTWASAKAYCPGLNLQGAGWRLPTVKELTTIVDVTQAGTSVDATAFPGAPSHYYWSSTPLAGDANNAWLVDFSGGAAYAFGAISVEYDMRCVR